MIQITVHKACPKNLHTVLRAAFRVSPSLHPLMPAALPEVLWGAPKVGHITQAVWYVKPFVLHLPMYMCSGDCLWFYCSNWRRNEFPVLSPFPLNGERPCVCVCAEKGPAGELCSEELGEFKGEAFGACLPQCGQEFSQSSHRKCAGFVGLGGHSLTQQLRVLNNTFSGSISVPNFHMCSVFKDQFLYINNQPWWFPVELSSLPVWNVHDISHIYTFSCKHYSDNEVMLVSCWSGICIIHTL